MSRQESLLDSLSATSSPALGDGPWHYGKAVGKTAAPCGPDHAPANLSPRQAREKGLLTSGTFGPPSTTSSPSAALQLSLESRLRARALTLGSTLYRLTWKPWVTPSGVSRFRLRASALTKSATGATGWPTPRATDGDKNIRTLAGALREMARKGGPQDLCQAALVSGGSASTESGARLNPELSRSLMRFPDCWSNCAPTAMPSMSMPRARSSKP